MGPVDGATRSVRLRSSANRAVDTLAPAPRARMAGEDVYGGYSRPLVDTWDEE